MTAANGWLARSANSQPATAILELYAAGQVARLALAHPGCAASRMIRVDAPAPLASAIERGSIRHRSLRPATAAESPGLARRAPPPSSAPSRPALSPPGPPRHTELVPTVHTYYWERLGPSAAARAPVYPRSLGSRLVYRQPNPATPAWLRGRLPMSARICHDQAKDCVCSASPSA